MKYLGTIVMSDIAGWPWNCPKVTMLILRGITGPVQLRENLMPPIVFTFGDMFHYMPKGKQQLILSNMLYETE